MSCPVYDSTAVVPGTAGGSGPTDRRLDRSSGPKCKKRGTVERESSGDPSIRVISTRNRGVERRTDRRLRRIGDGDGRSADWTGAASGFGERCPDRVPDRVGRGIVGARDPDPGTRRFVADDGGPTEVEAKRRENGTPSFRVESGETGTIRRESRGRGEEPWSRDSAEASGRRAVGGSDPATPHPLVSDGTTQERGEVVGRGRDRPGEKVVRVTPIPGGSAVLSLSRIISISYSAVTAIVRILFQWVLLKTTAL